MYKKWGKALKLLLHREVLILWAEQLMRSMDPYRQYQTIFLLQHQTVLKSAEI